MEWVLIIFIVAVIYAIGFLAGLRKAGKRKDDVRPMPAEQVQKPQRVEALSGAGTYKVVLYEVPQEVKLQAIKIIFDYRGGGLKESKDLSENLPKTIATGLSSYEAMMLQSKFLEINCRAEVEKAHDLVSGFASSPKAKTAQPDTRSWALPLADRISSIYQHQTVRRQQNREVLRK